MATSSTRRMTYKQESGKVTTVSDMQAHTNLAKELDEEDNWGLLAEDGAIIGGLNITHSSGNTFNINAGMAILAGQVLKDIASPQSSVTLDDNPSGSGGTRIDMVSVNGYTQYDDVSSSDKVVEPVTVTPLTGVAIGTANGSDTEFDLTKYNVILETLTIYVGGTKVAGWVFDPEAGAANTSPLPNNDGIKFDAAPTSGAITADFSHVVGGYEVTPGAGYNTRWVWEPGYTVTKGTPGGAAGSLPLGHIEVGKISVDEGWTGGSSGTSIDHEDKKFAFARDAVNDSSGHSPFDRPARAADLIRGMRMMRVGARLYYSGTDEISLTPGWLNTHGIAMVADGTESQTLTTSECPTTGWYPIFAIPNGSNTDGVGERPGLFVGQSGVNWLAQDDTSPIGQAGTLFLSWIYVTVSGSTVTLRKFVSDEDGWVWWDTSLTDLSVPASTGDINVSDWCPPGCKKIYATVLGSLNATSSGSVGDIGAVEVLSNKYSSTAHNDEPRIDLYWTVPATGTSYNSRARGVLRVEDDSGVRKVRGSAPTPVGVALL